MQCKIPNEIYKLFSDPEMTDIFFEDRVMWETIWFICKGRQFNVMCNCDRTKDHLHNQQLSDAQAARMYKRLDYAMKKDKECTY